MTHPRLDDLYKMVAHIYSEQNLARTTSATFSHFVEVCGMLTIHDRHKKREGVTVTDALCKAFGWYFPLLAKLHVRSVEELVYRKFPYVCPYCRVAPHVDAECKLVRGTASTVDHANLRRIYFQNQDKRPTTLGQWQKMFQDIYPREADDRGRSTIGLLEELGELAEAIRVFEKHPRYFAGEAADTFSYLMGIANEHAIRLSQQEDKEFSIDEEFLKRYPGLCTQCGSRTCNCPSVPDATVGRMAKELELTSDEPLFYYDAENFSDDGRSVAHDVLQSVGGYVGLVDKFPFDRGDANKALITLCVRIARAVQEEQPTFAERLNAEALKLGISATYAGSPRKPDNIRDFLDDIRKIWRELDENLKMDIKSSGDIVEDLGDILSTIKVLFVSCSPIDAESLRVSGELRAIRESITIGKKGNKIDLEQLPAATIDDLRRALLSESFEIVHFAGHASKDHLIFESADGTASEVPLTAIADLIRRYKSVKCVVLNACESVRGLTTPICAHTVGMADSISDDAAMEFSRGFYDALATGKDIEFSIEEGISAVSLKGFDKKSIKVLKEDTVDN